jgi:hypothetical protein
LLPLAKSTFRRASPFVHVQRMPWRKGASCMRGMGTRALGFSVAANALASPISPLWAIGGTARRVVSRSCALGSNGAHTAPCRSNREMSGRTSASWGCLPTTRPYEIRVQATFEKPDQISTMPTCGDNAETDLRVLAGGRIAELCNRDEASPSKSFETDPLLKRCSARST